MNQDQTPTYGNGVGLIVLATLGWSLSGIFVRFMPDLTGMQINCWRGLFMGLSLVLYLQLRYRGELKTRVKAIPLVAFLAVALFFALGSTMYVTALTLAATANVSCLVAVAPLFTALLSRAVTGEKPSLVTVGASVIALGGIFYVVKDGLAAGGMLGNVIALLTALTFACQTTALRRYRDIDMVPAVAAGGFAIFVIAALFGDGLNVGWREIAILAVMGPLQLSLPLVLFVRGAKVIPAVMMSLIVLLDVVLNPLWTWLGVGEEPTLNDFIGGAIIVIAVGASIVWGRGAARKAAVPQQIPVPKTQRPKG